MKKSQTKEIPSENSQGTSGRMLRGVPKENRRLASRRIFGVIHCKTPKETSRKNPGGTTKRNPRGLLKKKSKKMLGKEFILMGYQVVSLEEILLKSFKKLLQGSSFCSNSRCFFLCNREEIEYHWDFF